MIPTSPWNRGWEARPRSSRRRDTPETPSSRAEQAIPTGLEELLLACLEEEPADRPSGLARDDPWTFEGAKQWWALHLPDR